MGFRDKASLSPEDPEIQPATKHAEEVAHFLRTNLVQGKKEGDVYSAVDADPSCMELLLTCSRAEDTQGH